MNTSPNDIMVEVNNLKMYFPIKRGIFRRKVGDVKAVDDIDFIIKRNETLGLVGESGCGKTTTGRCISRLYTPTSGSIFFDGIDISRMPEKQLKPLRRSMGAIFQDPYGSLNPRQKAGNIVADPLRFHHLADKTELNDRVVALFRLVGLDPVMANRVPYELSGGQRKRIAIARALASHPSLVICDEPVSSLDVSVQAQIINLLEELQESQELTYLFLSRDLAMVQYISDRVAVMYLGRIMELATSEELCKNPLHPYTQALISATPITDPIVDKTRQRIVLEGEIPGPVNPPTGCHFHPRCPIAIGECREERPPLRDVGEGHYVACIRV
jgi:oligopeptide/dipeptide ABC transporter ATP-binding protein